MTEHLIKIEQEYYDAKLSGDKPFEIRLNDRGYKAGDTLTYTGLGGYPYPEAFEITYVTSFEQKPGWVVFGDKLISLED